MQSIFAVLLHQYYMYAKLVIRSFLNHVYSWIYLLYL